MRQIWDIPGGIHPPENKTQSTGDAIANIPLPAEIVLPLNQHIGAPAIPCVAVGDKVLKGQVVAEAQGLVSAPIHASTSGTISAIEQRFIPHPSGMMSDCIVITPDGEDQWTTLHPVPDYKALDHAELVALIRQAGIAGMGGAGFPTAVKLNPRADRKVHTLILNGTECEPYITADDMLMRERADEVVAGTLLLAHILGTPETILIGIEDNKPEAIAAMQAAVDKHAQQSRGIAIDVVSFPTKYPSGGEKQLIQILTGKEVPSGQIPATIGIVVQNVGTAVATYRAVTFGEPLVSRITTVVGETLKQQRNIEVLIGTPVDHVLTLHGYQAEKKSRLIIGGPMMGFTVEHTNIPVVKTTNCILVPSNEEIPPTQPAQACIRCGMCAEACPANLLPQQLFWYSQAEDTEKLEQHNLFDCIECGACSYVCPSNIPLVQYYRASKGTIRQQELAKKQSDRARQRFEFRQERIAKAEAEKEAKRLARKKAAEEAKKKLAAQAGNEPEKNAATSSAAGSTTPVPKTPEQASTGATDTNQLPKLERALSSAKSREERAQQQLAEAKANGEDARIEPLSARLKQAELKVKEAEEKLKAYQQGENLPSSAVPEKLQQKLSLSPRQKAEKNIETLQKRIATAEEKLAEAEQANASTTDALRQGVEKLNQKLAEAQRELEATAEDGITAEKGAAAVDAPTMSAAEIAIAKAQAKAAAQASMSDDEKNQAQIASLQKRLDKARERLAKAEAENNDNIDAFRIGVEKLEAKLAEAQQPQTTP
ncbi:Electron transport complex subunit RsxC [Thalassocella blandensis]|nr:Electron transport complex subunit RsxC [Thalassocella blandensis]